MPNGSMATTTVIMIRHGERDDSGTFNPDDGPPLNKDGNERAQTLRHVLGKSGVKAIYTSKFIRTKETAAPLAQQLNLKPTVIDDALNLKKDIQSKHAGETVLVVGHTDTIPELIVQLGGGTKPIIGENEFDNLFVATVFKPGKASVTRLKYGVKS